MLRWHVAIVWPGLYIQRKTLIRSSLERLEDALKHAVIRSDARLKWFN